MRTTRKIISAVLALCMLATTGVMSCFAATTDEAAVGDTGITTVYNTANQAVDDEYAYTKGDLGATYSPEGTTFKVWSPMAESVVLNRYATGSDKEEGAADLGSTPLEKLMDGDKWTGVWAVTIDGDIKNTYYTYTVTTADTTAMTAEDPSTVKKTTKETQDVYSVATGVNGNRSMVCDLDSTDPEGWENDSHVLLEKSTQSSVWEIHVKDFSYDTASGVSEENRGKYLAFTETGTTLNGEGEISTCIDYLKDLGITTVQINPFYDYHTVVEGGDDSQFNWGYDPQNYNVPEGSYSSNPYDGNVRINECKQMIQALHNAGISVVMDVVYNHTYSTDSCFEKTVPGYYYRLNRQGQFSNGSGCGNECATERAMYRDYVIQSLKYWVNEYHVDGFRFDLMGIMDVETMNLARAALDEIDPRLTMWGEGWSGGDSYHAKTTCTGQDYYPAIQANASLLSDRIGIFNDCIRDGIKGSAMTISSKGFVQGTASMAKEISYGVRANSVNNYKWQAKAPSQSVTYASCHDNATLYDQLLASTGYASYGTREERAVAMNKLASAILYTSQGINFTLAGEEMCRTKDGDTNSYKSAPELNQISWQNVVDYADVVSYYKGMMKIKSAFTPLTAMDGAYADSYILTGSLTRTSNQVSFTIANDQDGEWKKMAVIYNGAAKSAKVTLKDDSVTEWVIIANNETAGFDNLGEVSGSTFELPATSAVVAVDKESFDALNLKTGMGKVKVNYVYTANDEPLAGSVILQGNIGTKYQTTPSAAIDNSYVVSRVESTAESNVYTEEMQEVTYYYTDYVPDSLKNADLNGDGDINVKDATTLQRYIVEAECDITEEGKAGADLNYDLSVNVSDVTMLLRHIVGLPNSKGTVTVNHYYTDENGELQTLTASETIEGRVGDDYTTSSFKVVGYAPDPDNYPENASGKIAYGKSTAVNYYYIPSSTEVTLHVQHNGSLTWAPTFWIWGSNLKGVDTGNYSPDDKASWPGITITDEDGDGWYDYTFNYNGMGTYNVIISNNSATQTIDYKGFVDNEMWIVINDSKVGDKTDYLTFYTDNPITNPDAPIASQI